MFNNIIDPRNNKSYSIFSNEGKQLLKLLVNQSNSNYNQMGGVKLLDNICPISQEVLRNEKDSDGKPLQVVKTNEGHYYHEKGLIQWLNSDLGNGKDPLTKKQIIWVKRVNIKEILEKKSNGEFKYKTIDDNKLGETVWQLKEQQPTEPLVSEEDISSYIVSVPSYSSEDFELYETVALGIYGSTPWINSTAEFPYEEKLTEPWAIDFSDLSVYNKENETEKYIYQDIEGSSCSAFWYICRELLALKIGATIDFAINGQSESDTYLTQGTPLGDKQELKYWVSMWKGMMEHITENPPGSGSHVGSSQHVRVDDENINFLTPITILNWEVDGLIRFLKEVKCWNNDISNLISTNIVNYDNCDVTNVVGWEGEMITIPLIGENWRENAYLELLENVVWF